jgi:hypothetical protein
LLSSTSGARTYYTDGIYAVTGTPPDAEGSKDNKAELQRLFESSQSIYRNYTMRPDLAVSEELDFGRR